MSSLRSALVFLLALNSYAQIASKKSDEIFEHIRSMTVQIDAQVNYKIVGSPLSPRQKDFPLGSGFIADSAYHIVTARHVIEEFDKVHDQFIANFNDPSGSIDPNSVNVELRIGYAVEQYANLQDRNFIFGDFALVPATVLKRGERDIAILQASQPPNRIPLALINGHSVGKITTGVASFDTDFAPDWEPIGVSGYPLRIPSLVTTFGRIGARYAQDDNGDVVQLGSIQVNPGNSGGPVYRLSDGKVIGIAQAYRVSPLPVEVILPSNQTATFTAKENSGLAVIIPIMYALDLLH